MRLTIEADDASGSEIEEMARKAFAPLATLTTQSSGKKSNLTGEQTSYISLLVTFGAGVATNLIASAVYDLLKHGLRQIKVNGRDAAEMTETELKSIIDADRPAAE
jgi:hypothetical protein